MVRSVDFLVNGVPVRYKVFKPERGRSQPKTIFYVGFVESKAPADRYWKSLRVAKEKINSTVRAAAEASLGGGTDRSAAGEQHGANYLTVHAILLTLRSYD